MILVNVRHISTTAYDNSTQKEIYDTYRHIYTQFLELSSIKNDFKRSSYTNHLQSFLVTMLCSLVHYMQLL